MAAALLTMSGVASAQREVLLPEQMADYQRRLPAAIGAAQPVSFKSYLQSLQRTSQATHEISNAGRVFENAQARPLAPNAYFAHYVVPAMSPKMRLGNEFPSDGVFSGDVGILLAQDEYEPASFVLYPFVNQEKVQLQVSDLKSADDAVFPKENLDLKVVKLWYQNGNGWFSYFHDVGLELVP